MIQHKKLDIHFLITGVGIFNTALMLGTRLAQHQYDFIINAGIAGSFSKDLPIGSVVDVNKDIFSELGAENKDEFITASELFANSNDSYGWISNKYNFSNQIINRLDKATGITVNTVHGNMQSINKVKERFNPDVESMEGAAVMLASSRKKTPFLQLRSISNYVEPRNVSAWNMPLAINNLSIKLIEIMESLCLPVSQ